MSRGTPSPSFSSTGKTNEPLLIITSGWYSFNHLANGSTSATTADFSSLNLAQAVAIHCYEIYYGIIHAKKHMAVAPQLATCHELQSMYAYLEESLYSIDFLKEVSHIYWMTNIRRFFSRITLTSKDANIVRTVCKKLLLYQKNKTPKDLGDP